uniref:Uncharacterized protein n=1 Tax=Euplotes crassus TaxID=5936 RepID=A0A7S3KU85_EUPCR|mmetsp:Transcript_576/g.579  ORF Transcript_576/g.579 Transcript_576/m.579 type:complete len:189 (+) Transcript_576:1-567(+)
METNTLVFAQNLNQEVVPAMVAKPKGTRKLRKKTYAKINDDIRKEIILRVTLQGQKLKSVCEQLNINVSSAKNVLAIYKKEGRIEKKKYRAKRRRNTESSEASSFKQTCQSQSSGLECNEYTSSFGNIHQQEKNMNFQADLAFTSQNLDAILDTYCFCDLEAPMRSVQQDWASVSQQHFAPYGQILPF